MTGADAAAGGGVENGAILNRFATAVLSPDAAELTAARSEIADALGGAALTDTAAVVSLFHAIVRVADATGIPMEARKAEDTADFRSVIGVDKFAAVAEKGHL